MLKVKLQYFGHLMRKVDSLEKTLMLGNMCLEKHHPGKDHMTFRGTILYIREVRIEPRLDDGKKAGSVFT